MKKKIEMGKQYQTSHTLPRPARIIATDVKGSIFPVVALVLAPDGTEECRTYKEFGEYSGDGEANHYDLVEVKPKIKVEKWINVVHYGWNETPTIDFCDSRNVAETEWYASSTKVIARAIPFVWEGEEPDEE
jgi:hypothetical protein